MADFGQIRDDQTNKNASLPEYQQTPFLLLRPDEVAVEEVRASSRIKKKVSYNVDDGSQEDDAVTLLVNEEREAGKAAGLKIKKAPKRRRKKESESFRRSLVPRVDIVMEYKSWTLKDHVQVFGSMHVIEYYDHKQGRGKKKRVKVDHSSTESTAPLAIDQDKDKDKEKGKDKENYKDKEQSPTYQVTVVRGDEEKENVPSPVL